MVPGSRIVAAIKSLLLVATVAIAHVGPPPVTSIVAPVTGQATGMVGTKSIVNGFLGLNG